MIVVPAIDIRGGRCVRLVQGDYDRETVFGDDPAAMAERWIAEGARALHLVDLDGAKSGSSDNRAAVDAILRAVEASGENVVTDLGGGIRSVEAAARWLDAGIDRVVLGTVAVRDPGVVARAAQAHPGRIWVGIDARDGKAAVSGWTEDTGADAAELAVAVRDSGAAGIIYTDIDRDGTGGGVNVAATDRLARSLDIPVFASGGVRDASDVARLRAAGSIAGVIVGRALYDGTTDLVSLSRAAAGDGAETC